MAGPRPVSKPDSETLRTSRALLPLGSLPIPLPGPLRRRYAATASFASHAVWLLVPGNWHNGPHVREGEPCGTLPPIRPHPIGERTLRPTTASRQLRRASRNDPGIPNGLRHLHVRLGHRAAHLRLGPQVPMENRGIVSPTPPARSCLRIPAYSGCGQSRRSSCQMRALAPAPQAAGTRIQRGHAEGHRALAARHVRMDGSIEDSRESCCPRVLIARRALVQSADTSWASSEPAEDALNS